MIKTLPEDGMSGLKFIDDNVFHIEKSPIYTQLGEGVKSVEFVRSKGDKPLFVEARSSFPNPKNSDKEFREQIADICDKFTHSLNLYPAVDVGVTESDFPREYIPSDKVSLLFVLVINGFEKTWCDEVERALLNKIRESICMARIWKPEVCVLTYETAIKKKLTIESAPISF